MQNHLNFEKGGLFMPKVMNVRAEANAEKREMVKRGTPYRRSTAIYTSWLLNELTSHTNTNHLTKSNLVRMLKEKYHVNDERANDVAKNVMVQVARVGDRERLAEYYDEARKRLRNRDVNRLNK